MWQLSGILFTLAVIILGIDGAPGRLWSGGFGQEDDVMYEDYDLYYDQKQNGTENVRVNVDGVAFLVPLSQSMSSQAMSLLTGVAMDFLSGVPADSSDGVDYYDQEIAESPYIEHLAKPEKPLPSHGSQDFADIATQSSNVANMEITAPPILSSTSASPKHASDEENEIGGIPTLTQPAGNAHKGHFKDVHRRNKHTRPFFRPIFNRFLSRLISP